MRVLKYDLVFDARGGEMQLELPAGSKPIAAAEQHGIYRVWFEVHEEGEGVTIFRHHLTLLPTGFLPIPEGMSHVDTIFASNGNVWHLYHRIGMTP